MEEFTTTPTETEAGARSAPAKVPPRRITELRRPARLLLAAPLAVEAAVALSAATLALRLSSQARAIRLLGAVIKRTEGSLEGPDPRARRVGRAVSAVARLLPWRPACLPQAIATRWMLRRRGIDCESHLGVASLNPHLTHAWVTVQGHVVQGGPVDNIAEIVTLR